MPQLSVRQLNRQDINDFIGWRYDAPYDVYNLNVNDVEASVLFFLAPANGYFAVRDAHDALIGFCCFGYEGQVPGGDYALDALDVGIGMRPALTGQGLGYDFVAAVLSYAETTYMPDLLRVTVAVFNTRSQRVFEQHGFVRQSSFRKNTANRRQYVILVKEVAHEDR